MKIVFATRQPAAIIENKLATAAAHGEFSVEHMPSTQNAGAEKFVLVNRYEQVLPEMKQVLKLMNFRKEIIQCTLTEIVNGAEVKTKVS